MKFTVSRDVLLRPLQQVAGVVERRQLVIALILGDHHRQTDILLLELGLPKLELLQGLMTEHPPLPFARGRLPLVASHNLGAEQGF